MQQNWQRRNDFVDLDAESIATLVEPIFPQHSLESFELLTTGQCNTNYKFTLMGLTQSFVLRFALRDADSLQRDQHIFSLIKNTVPVPEILYIDSTRTRSTYAYSIMSWIEGILFSDILHSQEKAAIDACSYAVGNTLAAIGKHTFPRPGFFTPDLTITEIQDEVTWDWLPTIQHMLFNGYTGRHLGSDYTEQLWQFAQQHTSNLSVLANDTSLVHADFKGFNILMHHKRNSWSVAGILDWEFAFAGSPLFDIGNMLRYSHIHPPTFETQFILGYQQNGGQLPQGWQALAKQIDLLSLCQLLDTASSDKQLRLEVINLIARTIDYKNNETE